MGDSYLEGWGYRTEENGAEQQGIWGRVPAERMGLGEESGAALVLGCQAGKGVRGGKGDGLLGLRRGVAKKRKGVGRLEMLGWDGGCSRGFMGIKGYRNAPVEDWGVMDS